MMGRIAFCFILYSILVNSNLTSQNVGIGTVTPLEKLHVEGNAYFNSPLGIRLNAADRPLITRGWDAFASGPYAGLGSWGLFMEPSYLTIGIPNTLGKGIQWVKYNNNSTIGSNMMTLLDGKLGIGKTNPAFKLDIEDSQAVARLVSTNTTNGSVLELRTTSFFDEQDFIGAINFTNPIGAVFGQIGETHDGEMTFKSGGLERMRINTAGNLGIGSGSPQYKLDVNGDLNTSGKIRINGVDAFQGTGFKAILNPAITLNSGDNIFLNAFIEEFDDGAGFNDGTGIYTIPSTGKYHFIIRCHLYENTGYFPFPNVISFIKVWVDGVQDDVFTHELPSVGGSGDDVQYSFFDHFTAGQTVQISIIQSNLDDVAFQLSDVSFFSGFKVY